MFVMATTPSAYTGMLFAAYSTLSAFALLNDPNTSGSAGGWFVGLLDPSLMRMFPV